MKSVLRLTLLFCLFMFQTACSTFSDDDEENASFSAPVEDKSSNNRNPYSAVTQMSSDSFEQERQSNSTQVMPKRDANTPSLRIEEVPENNPPSAASTESPVMPTHSLWIWPTENPIIRQFDAGSAEGKGIDFSGKVGDSIRAVRSGKVVFSGAGLKGYGQLIIIKHDSNVLTAYAHNHNLLVKEGDLVDAGQVISEMGLNERTGTPSLHFEVRLNGKPVDPLGYLPSRR